MRELGNSVPNFSCFTTANRCLIPATSPTKYFYFLIITYWQVNCIYKMLLDIVHFCSFLCECFYTGFFKQDVELLECCLMVLSVLWKVYRQILAAVILCACTYMYTTFLFFFSSWDAVKLIFGNLIPKTTYSGLNTACSTTFWGLLSLHYFSCEVNLQNEFSGIALGLTSYVSW